MSQATVLDSRGRKLSSTSEDKAHRLVASGKASVVHLDPLTIRLGYPVNLPEPPRAPDELPGEGRRVLLHVCCAPCATYTAKRLGELGFQEVVGHWYNPNVHPFSEHERRRETLARYAQEIGLSMIWEPGYEVVEFMRAIYGREGFRVRCAICYRLRLERTVMVAAGEGFDAFTTTLLISPHQDQATIRATGEELAGLYGLDFYFENFRRGWVERGRVTREHGLYSQRYCGCLYSEWEGQYRDAATLVAPASIPKG